MEISPPTFLTAYTDGTLQLPCKPYQYQTMTVKWFHNDKEIANGSTLEDGSSKKISILPDGYLEISKIERSNAGIYKCEVSYGVGDATLREVRRTHVKVRSGITELSTPKFIPPSPKKLSALIGGSVMIPCHAGDRSPDTSVTEIRWEKDNKRLV